MRRCSRSSFYFEDRWLPSVSMWLVSLISYIDRNTLAILAPVILHDTHLNAEQYGFIISCFSVAYMIGNPVCGACARSRRRAPRHERERWESGHVASAAHAWATRLLELRNRARGTRRGRRRDFSRRFAHCHANPFAGAPRGRGLAIAYSGGSLGAMIAPLVVTPIAARFGWRGAFVFTGILGAAWLVFWRSPRRASTAPGTVPPSCPLGASGSIPRCGRSCPPTLWARCRSASFFTIPRSICTPALAGARRRSGKVLWIPPFGWEVGYFVWGAVIDRVRPPLSRADADFARPEPAVAVRCIHCPDRLWCWAICFWPCSPRRDLWYSRSDTPRERFRPDMPGFLAGIGAGSWGALVALTAPWFGLSVRPLGLRRRVPHRHRVSGRGLSDMANAGRIRGAPLPHGRAR